MNLGNFMDIEFREGEPQKMGNASELKDRTHIVHAGDTSNPYVA